MKFNEHDEVLSLKHGWGTVIVDEDEEDDDYPVVVKFEGSTENFTEDGLYEKNNFGRTLFTKEEAKIKFPEYPNPQLMKKGYIVVTKEHAHALFQEKQPRVNYETEYLFEVMVEK